MLVKYTEKVEIVSDPAIQGGKPCFKGTRLPVEVILLELSAGTKRSKIFNAYPSLPIGGIEEAVAWFERQQNEAA
jgi:uncharacterized protein (DUF433 family)